MSGKLHFLQSALALFSKGLWRFEWRAGWALSPRHSLYGRALPRPVGCKLYCWLLLVLETRCCGYKVPWEVLLSMNSFFGIFFCLLCNNVSFLLYSRIIHIHAETSTTIMTNEHTSLEKYTSHNFPYNPLLVYCNNIAGLIKSMGLEYDVHLLPLSVAFAPNSTHPRSRLYLRPDAPVPWLRAGSESVYFCKYISAKCSIICLIQPENRVKILFCTFQVRACILKIWSD